MDEIFKQLPELLESLGWVVNETIRNMQYWVSDHRPEDIILININPDSSRYKVHNEEALQELFDLEFSWEERLKLYEAKLREKAEDE